MRGKKRKKKKGRKTGNPLRDTRIAPFMVFCIEYIKGLYSPLVSQPINIIAKCYFFPFISINRDSLYRSRKGKLALRHRRTLKSSYRTSKALRKVIFFLLLLRELSSLVSFFKERFFLHYDFYSRFRFRKYFSFYLNSFFFLFFYIYIFFFQRISITVSLQAMLLLDATFF